MPPFLVTSRAPCGITAVLVLDLDPIWIVSVSKVIPGRAEPGKVVKRLYIWSSLAVQVFFAS